MRRLLWIIGLLALPARGVAAEDMPYVIRVTPSFAYLDVGTRSGVAAGDAYVVLREDGERWVQIAEVRVLRADPSFAIAEPVYVAEGETLEVLQRAMSMSEWRAMAEPEWAGGRREPASCRVRSLYLVGGGEWHRRAGGLTWREGHLMSSERGQGFGLGLRLSTVLDPSWRLNLTYKIGHGGDVTALGAEADVHLVPRGCDRSGPYLSMGAGMQHLTWETSSERRDSSNKAGLNLMLGYQLQGAASVLVEAGYQRVYEWDDWIDVSNIRTYAGVGRAF